MDSIKYVIGIDEAGRGPIAGPLTLGALVFTRERYEEYKKRADRLPEGIDSKLLLPEEREVWFGKIERAKEKGELDFAVSFVSESVIDCRGLAFAVKSAIRHSLLKLSLPPADCLVLLDGLLKAPRVFKNQTTIIRGDEKEPAIGLASIAAKVLRDRRLVELGREFPEWRFEEHKGYGTPDHYARIGQFGLSPIHRRSFLKNFNMPIKKQLT